MARPESRDVSPRLSGKLTGYLAILAGAFLFGMWATVGKFALANVPPITLAWFVQSITAVAFAPFLGRLRLRRPDWARVGVASVDEGVQQAGERCGLPARLAEQPDRS